MNWPGAATAANGRAGVACCFPFTSICPVGPVEKGEESCLTLNVPGLQTTYGPSSLSMTKAQIPPAEIIDEAIKAGAFADDRCAALRQYVRYAKRKFPDTWGSGF